MAVLEIPDRDALIILSIDAVVPDQLNRSIWSSRSQVVGLPGAEYWTAKAAIEPMATEDDERPWRAFIFGLRGRQNVFHLPIACQRHVGAMPLVNAASDAGYTLPLDGMEPSTRILRSGSFITVPLPSGHARTAMLTADLITNGSGEATAQLNFALGEVPANNVIVETAYPYIPVRSASGNSSMIWDNAVSATSFELVEAL